MLGFSQNEILSRKVEGLEGVLQTASVQVLRCKQQLNAVQELNSVS